MEDGSAKALFDTGYSGMLLANAAALAPVALHPCHCTDFATRCALARAVPVGEVGVGFVLEYA